MRTIGVAMLMATLGSAATPALAIPVRWNIEGVVRVVETAGDITVDYGPLLTSLATLGVATGSPFSLSLGFESDAVDVDGDPYRGDYRGSISLADFAIGAWQASFVPSQANQIVVALPPTTGLSDVAIWSSSLSDGSGPFDRAVLWGVELWATQPGLFESDAVPALPPEPGSLEPFHLPPDEEMGYATFGLVGGCAGSACVTVLLELSSIAAVPEPDLELASGAAVVALALARRRRASSAANARLVSRSSPPCTSR